MPDGFERPVYARDGRDTGDAASEGADLAEDGFVDDAPAPARDRQWTEEEKAVVVSECCWPGRRVGEVAQRYGLSVNRVNGWRSQARRGRLASPFSPEAEAEPVEAAQAGRTLAARKAEAEPGPATPRPSPAFAALEVEAPPPGSVGSVSIEARGVMVRLDGDLDTPRIAEIASALRALR